MRCALAYLFFFTALTICTPGTAHAQSFTGNGDGFSWHDSGNWRFGNVPSEYSNASISGFPVQLNLAATVNELGISSSESEGIFRTGSLSVNAPLSAREIECSRELGFFNMNANVNITGSPASGSGFVNISSGATFNLNSGLLTAPNLTFFRPRPTDASPTFNQNGGNLNVEFFNIAGGVNTSATIGPNDNVTEQIFLIGGGNLTCDRSLSLSCVNLCGPSALTVNQDITATNSFFLGGSTGDGVPSLVWNQGVITTPSFGIENAIFNRASGRLNVENFSFSRSNAAGMSSFTIHENDEIGSFFISAVPDFPIEATFEGPNSFGILSQTGSSVINFQQAAGETEGLAAERYSNLRFFGDTLNLGFDSDSTGGLDWVFRVDGNETGSLQGMIDDGRIVVTGADFSVEYDAAADVTYIQQTFTTVLGDVNLDGAVTFDDIPSFIAVLSAGVFQAEADCNEDGAVDFGDIPAFIAILISQ